MANVNDTSYSDFACERLGELAEAIAVLRGSYTMLVHEVSDCDEDAIVTVRSQLAVAQKHLESIANSIDKTQFDFQRKVAVA